MLWGGDVLAPAGLAVSAAAAAAALAVVALRFSATPGDSKSWPGPRVYPAAGVVASLFALTAAVEGLFVIIR